MRPDCSSKRRVVAGALAWASALSVLLQGAPTTAKILDRVAQIRSLSTEDAARGLPVRQRGVVTYYDATAYLADPLSIDLFVQDATGGIYVQCEKPLNINRGQQIELTGVTGPGEFAPVVRKPQLTVLGEGVLPVPKKASFQDLASGRQDSQWVEGEGIVHSAIIDAHHLNLDVFTGDRNVTVDVLTYPHLDLNQLIE